MRKTLLLVSVFLLASMVSAQPVQLTESDSLDFDMAGGEERNFSISFDTNGNFVDNHIVETRLRVSNSELEVEEGEDRVSGEEFNLNRTLNGSEEECGSVSGGKNYSQYICTFDSGSINGENTVNYRIESVPRLMPGKYQFELELLSNPSSAPAVENTTVNLGLGTDAELESSSGSIEVEINSSGSGNATVESYDSLAVGSPQGEDELVSGVSVEINTTEDSSGGTLRFEHDEDLQDVDVYRLENGEWVSEGIEVTERGNDFVIAEVPHFSTYAAFGEEENSSTPTTDTQDNSTDPTQNQETNSTESQDNETDSNNTEPGEQDQETTENQTEEETGQQQDDTGETPQQPDNVFIGQFTESPGAVGVGIILLIVIAVLGLDYTGRIDVKEKISELRNRSSEDKEVSFS
ncbi:MAG: hypothetical protein BRC27_00490 [Nanohaloarchaea archaeon SW_10_44_10]|nr:MAG: hypothetical protein BRC27_00490 [Nanohaloarchaea archaeon SW_10_44_10]